MTPRLMGAAWDYLMADEGLATPKVDELQWRPCCAEIVRIHGGNAKYGSPIARHQATIKHYAAWWNVDARELRKAVEELRPEAEALVLECAAHLVDLEARDARGEAGEWRTTTW